MNRLNTLLKVTLLLLLLGVFFNGTKAKRTASNRWTACYDQPSNKLFFQKQSRRLVYGDRCQSRLGFKMAAGWELIENDWNSHGYGSLKAGTKKTLLLPSGRRLLLAQWEKSGQQNRITVLEPELNKKNVKKHCEIKNASAAFSMRYDQQNRIVKVLTANSRGQRVWRACKI